MSTYITTPIYYVNSEPHHGHAYTTVAADVLARYHRQKGEDVFFLTGTDEHGTKVERTARDNGVEPQAWCDRLVEESWKPVLATIDAATDDFIRTTSTRHRKGVQKFWETLRANDHVYEADFEGPYCVGCEEFKRPGDLIRRRRVSLAEPRGSTSDGGPRRPAHDRQVSSGRDRRRPVPNAQERPIPAMHVQNTHAGNGRVRRGADAVRRLEGSEEVFNTDRQRSGAGTRMRNRPNDRWSRRRSGV